MLVFESIQNSTWIMYIITLGFILLGFQSIMAWQCKFDVIRFYRLLYASQLCATIKEVLLNRNWEGAMVTCTCVSLVVNANSILINFNFWLKYHSDKSTTHPNFNPSQHCEYCIHTVAISLCQYKVWTIVVHFMFQNQAILPHIFLIFGIFNSISHTKHHHRKKRILLKEHCKAVACSITLTKLASLVTCIKSILRPVLAVCWQLSFCCLGPLFQFATYGKGDGSIFVGIWVRVRGLEFGLGLLCIL